MKTTRLVAAGLFACLGLGLMTGCPVSTVSSTTPSPDANVAPADVIGLNGRLTFDSAAAATALTLNIKKFNTTTNLYGSVLSGITANTVAGGYYQFDRSEAGIYKIVYIQGSNVNFAAGNNTVGYINSKDFTFAAGDKMKLDAIDLFWDAQPTPLNTAVTAGTVNFAFKTKKVGGPYEYQIHVNSANKDSAWVTPVGENASASINLQTTGSDTYQIKYRSAGSAAKGELYVGESGGTPNIPFTVN